MVNIQGDLELILHGSHTHRERERPRVNQLPADEQDVFVLFEIPSHSILSPTFAGRPVSRPPLPAPALALL